MKLKRLQYVIVLHKKKWQIGQLLLQLECDMWVVKVGRELIEVKASDIGAVDGGYKFR